MSDTDQKIDAFWQSWNAWVNGSTIEANGYVDLSSSERTRTMNKDEPLPEEGEPENIYNENFTYHADKED